MTNEFDLITFGDMCVDLILSGADVSPEFGQVEKLVDDYTVEMGGSSCIFACQAARLGLRVSILGRVGADRFGEVALGRLQACGVDTHHVIVDPSLKTGLGVALCRGNDRAILTYPGSLDAIQPQDVSEDWLASARHLHHGSYFLQSRLRPAIPALFARARRLGLTISLDTNWDPEEKWGPELSQVFPLVDIFMPNEAEALRISGCQNLEDAVTRLHTLGAKLVVVKRGEQGAVLDDGSDSYTAAVQPAAAGDSIGAGDSFDAAFLAGWLRHLPLRQCLEIACQCGRSVASHTGGLVGQLTWAELSL
jgi:sugar/nucleoside kinase (ribokinase family)